MDILEIKSDEELKKILNIPQDFKIKFLTNEEYFDELSQNAGQLKLIN